MQGYIAAAVALVVAFVSLFWYIENQKDVIASLEKKIAEQNADAALLELEKSECRAAVKVQNETLMSMRGEYEKRKKELEARKQLPASVRYEVIYKENPTMEVESDECKDIKNLLDSIRRSGF